MFSRVNKLSVSVCMATYNGRHYIEEQLKSIIDELDSCDEIVIVDDNSKDDTVELIESFRSPLIRLIKLEKNRGHVQTFNMAIMNAKNDVIMLADQDDIWIKGRKNAMLQIFMNDDVKVLATGFSTINGSGAPIENPFVEMSELFNNKYLTNIFLVFLGRIPYYGCAMAVRRSFARVITPIPEGIEAHDIWIGLAGNINSCIRHVEEKTLLHRIHGSNVTKAGRSVMRKFISRLVMIRSVLLLMKMR